MYFLKKKYIRLSVSIIVVVVVNESRLSWIRIVNEWMNRWMNEWMNDSRFRIFLTTLWLEKINLPCVPFSLLVFLSSSLSFLHFPLLSFFPIICPTNVYWYDIYSNQPTNHYSSLMVNLSLLLLLLSKWFYILIMLLTSIYIIFWLKTKRIHTNNNQKIIINGKKWISSFAVYSFIYLLRLY